MTAFILDSNKWYDIIVASDKKITVFRPIFRGRKRNRDKVAMKVELGDRQSKTLMFFYEDLPYCIGGFKVTNDVRSVRVTVENKEEWTFTLLIHDTSVLEPILSDYGFKIPDEQSSLWMLFRKYFAKSEFLIKGAQQ